MAKCVCIRIKIQIKTNTPVGTESRAASMPIDTSKNTKCQRETVEILQRFVNCSAN